MRIAFSCAQLSSVLSVFIWQLSSLFHVMPSLFCASFFIECIHPFFQTAYVQHLMLYMMAQFGETKFIHELCATIKTRHTMNTKPSEFCCRPCVLCFLSFVCTVPDSCINYHLYIFVVDFRFPFLRLYSIAHFYHCYYSSSFFPLFPFLVPKYKFITIALTATLMTTMTSVAISVNLVKHQFVVCVFRFAWVFIYEFSSIRFVDPVSRVVNEWMVRSPAVHGDKSQSTLAGSRAGCQGEKMPSHLNSKLGLFAKNFGRALNWSAPEARRKCRPGVRI